MSESASTKGQNLIVEIPEGKMEQSAEDSVRRNIPFSPTPVGVISRGKSSMENLLPKLCLQNTISEIEEVAISRTLTPTEAFNPRIKRTLSLPATTIALSNPHSSHGGFNSPGTKHTLHQSYSVTNLKEGGSTIHMGYVGRLYHVIPSTTQITDDALATSAAAPSVGKDRSDDLGKDVTKDAVCRICLLELGEGSGTLKLECCCKGKLALAHQECAVKWFTLRGNKICDVCRKEVHNLPVTLSRIANNYQANGATPAELALNRFWKDFPFLFGSMTAYCLFMEELLARRGSYPAPKTVPFSFILGLIAHMISIVMARKYTWIYALVQFGLVVLSGHVLYLLLQLDAFTSVTCAVLAGFGLAMGGTMILPEFMQWIRRQMTSSSQQPTSQEAMHPNRSLETSPTSQIDAQQNDLESENSRVDSISN